MIEAVVFDFGGVITQGEDAQARLQEFDALMGWSKGTLRQRLFAGDVTQMVAHLLDGCEAGPEELAELKKLIRQKEQELRDAQ